jgi:hypothetical protein
MADISLNYGEKKALENEAKKGHKIEKKTLYRQLAWQGITMTIIQNRLQGNIVHKN